MSCHVELLEHSGRPSPRLSDGTDLRPTREENIVSKQNLDVLNMKAKLWALRTGANDQIQHLKPDGALEIR